MRNPTLDGRRTPSPPTSPPGPKYEHSEHRVDEEPMIDFDGPGKSEAEMVDTSIFTVVVERYRCRREGCECRAGHNHLYTLGSFTDGLYDAVKHAVENSEWYDKSMELEEAMCEYAGTNCTLVDHDGKPILAIEFGDTHLGYVYPTLSVSKGSLKGSCHGEPERPSPEPHGL